ncbi:thiamine phosphate synthase [Dokdonia sp. 4H-3-7-5]|jgi:thiamine-phosphate pyrophosphorylase|uniref:thiamine phosphate synthase n=1 Tax=Dokdonia sp. (strain 4H-3-7-5) TaxID=983548 RepID=UPI00020A66A7|nr:thiamine phosphate synthase [Dokdonia sp. 4H-3-7-5]AEE20617.1 thiamine monophosphate synthase [Dokdonia sp. 4H-3-7-5]
MIPKLHYISQGSSLKEHIEHIQKACNAGAELVQLRVKDCSQKKLLAIAQEAREITAHFQTRLIINDDYKIAKEVKADGVHLGSADACPITARKHLYTWQIIGGTAHTLQDCEALIEKQVDYISLGPYSTTTTKETTAKTLGTSGYKAIIDELATTTPMLAVGGITLNDVKNILEAGIDGIAVSQAITTEFNSIRSFNELLGASSTQEQRHSFE